MHITIDQIGNDAENENGEPLDPRARRTRQLLQEALVVLMEEKDFQKITVADITDKAGVNRATFYAHFEDKLALFSYVVKDWFESMLTERMPQASGFNVENLRALTLIACEFVEQLGGSCTVVTLQQHLPTIISQLQNYLYTVILGWLGGAPSSENDAPPEVVAMTTSAMIFGSVMLWVRRGRKQSAETLTDQIVGMMQSGLQSYLV